MGQTLCGTGISRQMRNDQLTIALCQTEVTSLDGPLGFDVANSDRKVALCEVQKAIYHTRKAPINGRARAMFALQVNRCAQTEKMRASQYLRRSK